MLVLIRLAFLVAVAPSPSIPSLELEASLHGSEPYEALIVSNLNSVDDIAYLGALEHLKQAQDYRFVMELGFNRIDIGGSDTLFAFDTYMPSDHGVRESVGKLRTALQTTGCDLSADEVSNLMQQITDLSTVPAKRKLHRIDQITFLVERFDAFKSRFLSDDNVNGYVNHDQTRTEQLDTVYRILYGHNRPDVVSLQDFNLAKINLNLAEIGLARSDVLDVSRKLTIPYDKAPDMLSFAIDDAVKRSDRKHLNKLRLLVDQLWYKYAEQVREYSKFVSWATPTPSALTQTNLVEDIRIVQRLRSQALTIYESFKLPYPFAQTCVFSIYLYDPEERGLRFSRPNAAAFHDLHSAIVFAHTMVIPSFDEVSVEYYSRLRDVVLFASGPVRASTLDAGRAMALFDSGETLDTMMYVVRHECGHSLHYKMGYHEIRKSMLAVARPHAGTGLSSEMHALLERAHNLFDRSHLLKPVAYADYKDAIYMSDKKKLVAMIDRLVELHQNEGKIQDQHERELSHFSMDDLFSLLLESETLKTTVRLNDDMQSRFFGTFLGSNADSVGSSSYYAMSHVDEDVAELFQQLASTDMREALVVQARSDTILQQKVYVLLDNFDGKPMPEQRGEQKELAHPAPPVTVVIASENGKQSAEVIKSANSYVAQQIKRNRDVSFMSLEISLRAENGLRILQQSNKASTARPEKIYFFPDSSKENLPALEETLNRLGIRFDGRRVDCVKITIG